MRNMIIYFCLSLILLSCNSITIDDNKDYLAIDDISAINTTIEPSGNVVMKAGSDVKLFQGFHAKYGSEFIARSEDVSWASKCSLYKNGVQVVNERYFSACKVDVSEYGAETKFRIDNLTDNGTVFGLLLNQDGDLIGFTNNYIEASDAPSYLVLGVLFSDVLVIDNCDVYYTEDNNLEYLSLCGNETRHAVSGNAFIDEFDSGSYYYQYVLRSYDWQFLDWRMNRVDGVDLVFIHTHGNTGIISVYDETPVDFTSPNGSCGSEHKTYNRSGDLEYIAFMTCYTVKIESESSWGWLVNTGWQSTSTRKGFFDGVHVVLGFHTKHSNKNWGGGYPPTYYIEAKHFARLLDMDLSVWDSWRYATDHAITNYHRWWPSEEIDLGENSSIHIVPNQDDKLSDHKTMDYKYGDQGYYFGWRKYHVWYE